MPRGVLYRVERGRNATCSDERTGLQVAADVSGGAEEGGRMKRSKVGAETEKTLQRMDGCPVVETNH